MANSRKTAAPRARAAKAGEARQKQVRITPQQREVENEGPISKHWRTYFLQALAETSNVTESCRRYRLAVSRVYKTRRDDAAFREAWRAALAEGYEHLEMEVLGYLRDPDPARKYDVANALRLLAAHRQTVASVRADDGEETEQEVLESLDRFIGEMREKSLANNAAIAETVMLQAPDGH